MEKSADITLDRPAQLPRFVADSANFEMPISDCG
jgi:hypothetical protein